MRKTKPRMGLTAVSLLVVRGLMVLAAEPVAWTDLHVATMLESSAVRGNTTISGLGVVTPRDGVEQPAEVARLQFGFLGGALAGVRAPSQPGPSSTESS